MGILHGARTKLMQNAEGQITESHSVSAGLDYPGVGPEHAYLQSVGRAEYVSATDQEALDAFVMLSQKEGIIPAFESAHAVAHGIKMARSCDHEQTLIINISGRGDKDMDVASELLRDRVNPVIKFGVKK